MARNCGRCRRYRGACICANVQRGHTRTARKAGVNPNPHPCPHPGCGRTVRGGICPSPDH